jgi:DNA-directed RNA polymerase alpha subunit
MVKETDQRAIDAAEMYARKGMTYADVGAAFGVSKGRACSLVQKGRRIKEQIATHDETVTEGLTDETPIDRLNLSVRARNALVWLEVKTVGQARALTDRDMLDIPNMGWKSLREIRDLIGYKLPGRVEELKQQKAKLEARLREINAELTALGAGD